MNCQSAREHFIELLHPERAPAGDEGAAFAGARAHLAHCPECQREFAVLSQTLLAVDSLPVPAASPRLRQSFYALLEEEKNSAASAQVAASRAAHQRVVRRWAWLLSPLGAAALVAIGFVSGRQTAPAPAPSAPIVATIDPATKRVIDDLRSKVDRMEAMNQLVAAALQPEQRPAGERFRGVLTSAAAENPGDPVLNELITSLALDSSANVRLRALEALYAHADREVVRAGVLASLSRESNPLVQVAMIDFLAAARDREARPTLERMAVSEAVDTNVREAARRAVAQL